MTDVEQLNSPNPEKNQAQELPLPPNWTYLIHLSNLDKPEWSSEAGDLLAQDTLSIKGNGLSTITKESRDERQETARQGVEGVDKVGNYGIAHSSGTGTILEMRIVFPAFSSRRPLSEEVHKQFVEKYGEDAVKAVYSLANLVHWKNHQQGRHPILPRGMNLIKIQDENIAGNNRVIQYVPEMLMDIYKKELTS